MVARSALTAVLGVGLILLLAAAAAASGHPNVVRVSHCPGPPNAEVVQAVDGRYVYEAWIGCDRAIGFARSLDGGRTFGRSTVVRGSHRKGLHAWDPAIAVAPNGTVYVSYMTGPPERGFRSSTPMRPAVAISHDHGRTFPHVSLVPVPAAKNGQPNWGDREFIAVGPRGTVYLTWDYGPRRADVRIVCPPTSSCYFRSGDFNAVFQKSSDGGKTWTSVAPISPGFPLGGVYSAPIVTEPDGALDVLYWQHPTDPQTLAVSPGHEYFIRSTNGGATWTRPVLVGAHAGTIGPKEWWIDGSLAVDGAGTLYAAWDTQRQGGDTGWLAWSTNGGGSWSSPLRIASSRTEHLTEVAAAGGGSVYVGWQTIVRGKGYATFLRRYTRGRGWTGRARKVSAGYGKPRVWPGDTFGLSVRNGSAVVSWGSANSRPASQIYASVVRLPAR